MVAPLVLAKIKSLVRAAHHEYGWRIFWPQQFIDADVGDEEVVVSALAELSEQGFFRVRLQIRCAEGHVLWEGEPTAADGLVLCCDDCADDDTSDRQLFLKFILTDKWPDTDETPSKKAQRASG